MVINKQQISTVSVAVAIALGLSPGFSQAQVLEEVVVTAQAREQVLQDVPISMEVVSGEDLVRQGLKDINELSGFSPSLWIDPTGHSGGVQMRGVGTVGANLSFEMAVPIFVDGIHFGRRAQTRAAFLDIERVETLRGPQPVYFGQNASAGAISITSRKPTQEWDGRLITEVGNNGVLTGEFGVGGPLTDTLGIRIAGKYEEESGYMRDIITRAKYPAKQTYAGRVILAWTPNDQLNATFKFEYVDNEAGEQAHHVSLSGNGNFNTTREARAWLAVGIPGVDTEPLRQGVSNWGVKNGPLWIEAPFYVDGAFGLRRAAGGAGNLITFNGISLAEGSPFPINPDVNNPAYVYPGDQLESGIPIGGNRQTWTGFDVMTPWNSYLKLEYELGNGMLLESQTGYSRLKRSLNRLSTQIAVSPFPLNPMMRSENFRQWSQELSLSSAPTSPVEWMVMGFWQDMENDHTSDSWRLDQNRQLEGNRSADNGRWLSLAGTATINFFDDKFSLDVGARYTDVKKRGQAQNISGNWILEEPVGANPNDVNIIDRPAPGLVVLRSGVSFSQGVNANIWHGARVVGYTPPKRSGQQLNDVYTTSSLDPQVVLRWRPTEDISLYARYAEAFKSGGFDTAVTAIVQDVREFSYDDETAESVEVGMRGRFLDGRITADISISESNFYGLQLSSPDPGSIPEGRNVTRNAAQQRVRALEFGSRAALTEQLQIGLMGALMDGTMVDFPFAVCTQAEFDLGVTTDLTAVGVCRNMGGWTSIDRSGQDALNSPDWNFTADVEYWIPFMDKYQLNLNAKINHSDGYVGSYLDTLPMPVHTNLNLTAGIADQAGVWEVSAWIRNVFETLPEYDRAADLVPNGLVATETLTSNNFRRYGLKFRYNFF